MNLYVYNLCDDYDDKFTIISNVIETNKLYQFQWKSPLYASRIKKKEFNDGAWIHNSYGNPIVVLLEADLDKAKKLSCEFIANKIEKLYEQINNLYNQELYIQEYGVGNND